MKLWFALIGLMTELPNLARPVLQRLGQVGCLNLRGSRQIGNGAAEFEDAMIGPRTKVHLLHGGAHEVFAGFIQLAKHLHFGRPHVTIDEDMGFVERRETGGLDLAGRFHPLADDRRSLAIRCI